MRCSKRRRNQQEEQREVIQLWRNHQKTIFAVKMSQAKPPFIASPPSPLPKLRRRIFHMVRENVRVAGAEATRHGDSPVGGGRAGWSADWCHSITKHWIGLKFNMKMDNDVLLLCYLDKICLTLTGDLWRALASLYSEDEAISGTQNGDSPSVDYTTFYRQHLCVNEGSQPQQHTWNSKALFFPAQIYWCTIVYIFNILCGLKVIVSRQ